MTATTDATGTTTIVLTREDIEALYVRAAEDAFVGSDERDLNQAYTDGFMAALDIVRGLRAMRP